MLPTMKYTVPALNHKKPVPYVDYPIVFNAIATYEAFYVEYPFTYVTSNPTDTTLYKWNGGGWTPISGLANPDVLFAQGYYSVTTTAPCYVSVTEHANSY